MRPKPSHAGGIVCIFKDASRIFKTLARNPRSSSGYQCRTISYWPLKVSCTNHLQPDRNHSVGGRTENTQETNPSRTSKVSNSCERRPVKNQQFFTPQRVNSAASKVLPIPPWPTHSYSHFNCKCKVSAVKPLFPATRSEEHRSLHARSERKWPLATLLCQANLGLENLQVSVRNEDNE